MNSLSKFPPRPRAKSSLGWLPAALFLLLPGLLGGCRKAAAPPPAAAAKPPQEVTVVAVEKASIPVKTELPGRLEVVRVAEVRARANGIVMRQLFREGTEVKENDVLFEIDPPLLKANVASAKAGLAKAEADVRQSEANLKRYEKLVAANAISRQEYEQAIASSAQAKAAVQTAAAALETAQINLGYAKVTAPISGLTGKAKITEGGLVSAAEATPLVTIQQLDRIYFDFTQSSSDVLKLRRMLDSGELKSAGEGAAKVTLLLEDGSTYAEAGKLLFSDVRVDPTTGMVTLRAEFPNPKRFLLPGMFARGILEQAVNDEALTVPQQAVARGPNGTSTVMVVGGDSKVELRKVQTGRALPDKWIITNGLKAGERVIVEGLQKVKPGAVVKAITATTAAQPSVAEAN